MPGPPGDVYDQLKDEGVVFLSLAAMHLLGKTVATNSIGAMLFRTAMWTGINVMIRGKRQGRGR